MGAARGRGAIVCSKSMMRPNWARPAPPSPDKRWKILDGAMRRHGYSPRALIETLHAAQGAFGYLDQATLAYVASWLRVPLSKAFGVATFYHLFRMRPAGKHTCLVCTGTACHIKGAGRIVKDLETKFSVAVGETTPDGEVTLLAAHCIGRCGVAPAAVLDEYFIDRATTERIMARVEKWVPA